jgi:outer membrane protein assembly factor BamB
MPRHRTDFFLRYGCLLAGAAIAACMAPALGAGMDNPAPAIPAPTQPATQPADVISFLGKDPAEGMLIPDVTVNLTPSEHREQIGQWGRVADTYQKVIDASGDRIMPVELDAFNQATRYTNFGDFVQDRLARWPSKGIELYRAKFEAPARKLLDSVAPDDLAALDEVYHRYFCTDAGKAAGIRMLGLYMGNGQYAAAASIGDRLLSMHPNLQDDRPGILYRTALAYSHAGNQPKAAECQDELSQHFPNEKGSIRGEQVVLAEALARELSAKPMDMQSPDSWPMPGGDPSRGRISPASARATVRLFDIAVAHPSIPPIQPPVQPLVGLPVISTDTLQNGRTIGILPVIDRGELFFQDGQHVFGVSAATGAPLAGWSKTYANGVYTLAGVTETARRHQLSLALADNSIVAIMANPDQQGQSDAQQRAPGAVPQVIPFVGEPKLVCLDRASGAEQWTTALSKLPDSAKDASGLQMTGSPLVVGPSVLVVARGPTADRAMENCCVVAFDLKTGAYRWSSFVAGHRPLAFRFQQMRSIAAQQAEVAAHLAYADGRVYVQSNLGVLAALDPASGAVAWLDIFSIGREPPKGVNVSPMWLVKQLAPIDHKPWAFNPVIVQAGHVFTMPTEGHFLHVCDAETGREINRIDLLRLRDAAPDPGSRPPPFSPVSSTFDTIVGVDGDAIVLASDRALYCLDWKKYDPAAVDPLHGATTKWIAMMPASIRGRAFMTSATILVPCGDRMYCLSRDTGKVDTAYPSTQPAGAPGWKDPEEPGNVLAIGDKVIVAGENNVTVYGEHPMQK